MKILNRFLSIIFSVGFIPVLPVFIFLIFYQTSGKDKILRYHLNIAEISASMAKENLAQLSLRLSNYEQMPPERICSYAFSKNPDIPYIAVFLDNKKICSSGLPFLNKFFDHSDLALYVRDSMPPGKKDAIIGNFRIVGDMPIADVIYPLQGGKLLYCAVNLRETFSSVYMQKIGKSGSVYFASPYGRIFSFSGFTPALNFSSLSSKLYGDFGFFKGLSDNKNNYVGGFARVADLNLYAITLQPESEAFREINLASSAMLFMLLLLLTVFYFVALTAAGNISMPINRLISAADRISKNDFSKQVKPDAKIKEINTLISAFNSMMKSLHRYQQLQVEKVLREKEKMDLLADLINDGIVLADFTGEAVYLNPAAKDILKKSKDTVQRSIALLVKLAAQSKGKPVEFDWEKGSFYSISIKVSPSKLEKPLAFIVVRDVSAEYKIRAVREDFFRCVAHDVRAPILNMQGYAKLLSFNIGDKVKSAEYIKGIEEESERIFRLVESVLEMSRLESKAFKINFSILNVFEFLKKTAERFSPVMLEKNIKLELNCPADIKLKADEMLLSRAVDNILSNACKFSFENGVIKLSARKEGGEIFISIKDYGPGISKDKLEKIFEKFTGYDPRGFGLGLSIAKAAAKAHGGSVGAISDGKSGSEFFIRLKAA